MLDYFSEGNKNISPLDVRIGEKGKETRFHIHFEMILDVGIREKQDF